MLFETLVNKNSRLNVAIISFLVDGVLDFASDMTIAGLCTELSGATIHILALVQSSRWQGLLIQSDF